MPRHGQSLSEYSLLGAVVLTASLGALLLLSSNVQTTASNMVPSRQAQTSALNAAPGAQSVPVPIAAGIAGAVYGITPQDTQQAILVAGANGATTSLATGLENKIRQWLADGAITDAQANQLLLLANQGHAVANAEKMLENAIAQGQSQVSINGKSYETWQVAQDLGMDPLSGSSQWTLTALSAQPLMTPFVQQYQAALQSGALADPAIQTEVADLSYQIVALGDAVSWNFDTLKNQGQLSSGQDIFRAGLVQDFSLNLGGAPIASPNTAVTASQVTHSNSASICTIGISQDTGTQCR